MKFLLISMFVISTAVCSAQSPQSQPLVSMTEPQFLDFGSIQWSPIMPDLGSRSPEIAILHIDPQSKATELMIRVPKNFHVPKHWHTANETHTIVSGKFIMQGEGHRAELSAGGFNFTPAKMIHEGWTPEDQGALLFITVDGAWDVNFVTPPTPEDMAARPPKTPE